MIHTLNRNYVLAPFHVLMSNCQNNVLMGLRIVQTLEKFPDPTPEDLHFFQLSFAGPPTDLSRAGLHFKNWTLAKGFGDIQKCIRATLERLFIFRTVELKIKANEKFDIGACEKELWRRARQPGYPALVDKINSLFDEPLRYQDELNSFNNARNCLEHENGVVTEKRCTNPEKNKLVIHGTRFKMFFKRAQAEVLAELGKPDPKNSPLMLGAEEFQIEFGIGQLLEISLKQFIDILNTCVFIRADIESWLSKTLRGYYLVRASFLTLAHLALVAALIRASPAAEMRRLGAMETTFWLRAFAQRALCAPAIVARAAALILLAAICGDEIHDGDW